MTDSDFEKYYQKGGTYVLPIEVFNELFGEMENWKKECKQKENIIKEVREYIEKHSITNIEWWITRQPKIECKFMKDTNPQELLEILDKGE